MVPGRGTAWPPAEGGELADRVPGHTFGVDGVMVDSPYEKARREGCGS